MFNPIKALSYASAKHAAEHPIAHALMPIVVGAGVKLAVHRAIVKVAEKKLEQMKHSQNHK